MPIDLWSRREGLHGPPATPVYADERSRRFPETFRVRVAFWLTQAFGRIEWGNVHGDVFNDTDHTIRRLYVDLCEAYGRGSLISPQVASPLKQLRGHVSVCPDVELLNLIDAVFQESAFFIEQAGGADPIEEPERLAQEINRVFAEEAVGYRRIEGRLVRLDDEVTHHEAKARGLIPKYLTKSADNLAALNARAPSSARSAGERARPRGCAGRGGRAPRATGAHDGGGVHRVPHRRAGVGPASTVAALTSTTQKPFRD